MKYIGIDIGGTKCAVLKSDGELNIERKISFPTSDLDTTLDRIFDAVEELMPADRIGISCGGPLDEHRGVILSPPNLPGFDNVMITDMLTERFGIPARLCNDANACALAEWKFGAGRGCRNMVFLTFGTGLGAGLILDGRLYSGSNGNAGEAGHIRLDASGPVGYGKSGSFEGFCSGGGIARLAISHGLARLNRGDKTSFGNSEAEIMGITTKELARMAYDGDEEAIEVFRHSGSRLGMGLSILIDILNPDAIVIGSVFARAESLLRPEMERVIAEEALAPSAAVCKILPAALGESIGDVAAISVAMEE